MKPVRNGMIGGGIPSARAQPEPLATSTWLAVSVPFPPPERRNIAAPSIWDELTMLPGRRIDDGWRGR